MPKMKKLKCVETKEPDKCPPVYIIELKPECQLHAGHQGRNAKFSHP